MKKRLLVMLSIVACFAILAGCSGKASETSAVQPSVTVAASEDASQGNSESKDYLSWTKNEWDAASQEDKIAASIVLMKQLNETIAQQDAATLKPAAGMMVSTMDMFFAENPQATLKEAADQIKDFMPQQQ